MLATALACVAADVFYPSSEPSWASAKDVQDFYTRHPVSTPILTGLISLLYMRRRALGRDWLGTRLCDKRTLVDTWVRESSSLRSWRCGDSFAEEKEEHLLPVVGHVAAHFFVLPMDHRASVKGQLCLFPVFLRWKASLLIHHGG